MIVFDIAIIIIVLTNLSFMVWGYKYLVMLFHMIEDGDNKSEERRHE